MNKDIFLLEYMNFFDFYNIEKGHIFYFKEGTKYLWNPQLDMNQQFHIIDRLYNDYKIDIVIKQNSVVALDVCDNPICEFNSLAANKNIFNTLIYVLNDYLKLNFNE